MSTVATRGVATRTGERPCVLFVVTCPPAFARPVPPAAARFHDPDTVPRTCGTAMNQTGTFGKRMARARLPSVTVATPTAAADRRRYDDPPSEVSADCGREYVTCG